MMHVNSSVCVVADVQYAHLFDADYFRFLRRLIEAYTQMFHVGNHKLRRMEYASSPVKSSSGSGTNEDGVRSAHRAGDACCREEEEQHLADVVLRLALNFLFKVEQPLWLIPDSEYLTFCMEYIVVFHCLLFGLTHAHARP